MQSGMMTSEAPSVLEGSWSRDVTVRLHEGLHARPATQLVKLAKGFAAKVELDVRGKTGNARSAVSLMLLAVKEGEQVHLRTGGAEDAEQALAAVAAFLGTEDQPVAKAAEAAASEAPVPEAGLRGLAASEGQAIGPAFPFFPETLPDPERGQPPQPEVFAAELARWRDARATAVQALQAGATGSAADIVEALVDVACDPDLEAEIEQSLADGYDATGAMIRAGAVLAGRFEALDDPYMSARAEDVRGITRNIALTLLGRPDASLEAVPDGAIVLAEELHAWDLAKVRLDRIGGIVCVRGAATAHAAIMARTHGIPAVLGCASLPRIAAGTEMAIDGSTGAAVIAPDAATLSRVRADIAARGQALEALSAYRDVRPLTADGIAIEVAANLGSLREIPAAQKAGAMGVGLFRTELLFMEHNRLLSEDEQADCYLKLADAFRPFPVIVRTLDIGGDKPLPSLDIPAEDNPFLGWRGIRICLDRPDVFKPQLKALLRASIHGNLKIMLPMVADASEVERTRALLDACVGELAAAGTPHGRPSLGIMIETPAAVLMAPHLAGLVDFFSIGTNDLTQYVMAADRMNPRVASLNRPDHPAVQQAIRLVCEAAASHGIPVGVCGEAAARPDLIPAFLRLGVTELSMSPSSVLRAKKIVESVTVGG